jgi:hypothetical protein
MRAFTCLLLTLFLLSSTSCDRDHEDKKTSSKHKSKPKPVAKEKHDPSKEIEELTGAHTRLVWAECAKTGTATRMRPAMTWC